MVPAYAGRYLVPEVDGFKGDQKWGTGQPTNEVFSDDLGPAEDIGPGRAKPSSNLTERDQVILLANTAFRLSASGRLTEALEPIREAVVWVNKLEE